MLMLLGAGVAFGNGDQGVGVLVEEGAGAGIEARDDLVEAPADGIAGRVAVLVHVDEELDALDGARFVEAALAVFGEELVGAVHDGGHHDPAVQAAGTAAQATAALRSVPATLGRSAPNPLNSRTDIFSATYGV